MVRWHRHPDHLHSEIDAVEQYLFRVWPRISAYSESIENSPAANQPSDSNREKATADGEFTFEICKHTNTSLSDDQPYRHETLP